MLHIKFILLLLSEFALLKLGTSVREFPRIMIYKSRPRITWFYDAYIDHEYAQVVTNWQDKLEESARQFLTS